MPKPLEGRVVILGITGSIAAYKGAEVARRLMDLGAEVHATLTWGGAKFITPLTLSTVTGNQVTADMFDEPEVWEIKHVSLAQAASAVVVAPATADAIAKLALGLADEFLYTLVLATQAPLFVAPAMNEGMLASHAVQQNLAALRARGVHIIEPETGRLASGAVGKGRLAHPEFIAKFVADTLSGTGDLNGARVIITAGPTREPLDPVRFISNRSSGKMGYALAQAAARRGAAVTLIFGPATAPPPAGCELVPVETTRQMYDAVLDRLQAAHVVIGAAAPADFAPASPAPQKIKKVKRPLSLHLEPTPDIIAECGRRKKAGQLVVGFAAETENLLENARAKLQAKNLDMIVANDVSAPGAGFDSDDNAGHLLFADGRVVELPAMAKTQFADRILDAVSDAVRNRRKQRKRPG